MPGLPKEDADRIRELVAEQRRQDREAAEKRGTAAADPEPEEGQAGFVEA